MGKFSDLETLATSVFSTTNWQNENIVTHPSNFTGDVKGNEYIRVAVVTSNSKPAYTDLNSMAGQIVIEIFTKAGEGPLRSNQIADVLDRYLAGKIFSSQLGTLQMSSSLKSQSKVDTANNALSKAMYVVNLNYFGK